MYSSQFSNCFYEVSYADMDNSIDNEEKEERVAKRKRVGTITREEWDIGSQVH